MPFVNSFLNYWKPCVGIFIDSEIWPCMFKSMSKKNIPILLINARLTKRLLTGGLQLEVLAKKYLIILKLLILKIKKQIFF